MKKDRYFTSAPFMGFSFSQVALTHKPGLMSQRLMQRTDGNNNAMADVRKTYGAIRALTPFMQQLHFNHS